MCRANLRLLSLELIYRWRASLPRPHSPSPALWSIDLDRAAAAMAVVPAGGGSFACSPKS